MKKRLTAIFLAAGLILQSSAAMAEETVWTDVIADEQSIQALETVVVEPETAVQIPEALPTETVQTTEEMQTAETAQATEAVPTIETVQATEAVQATEVVPTTETVQATETMPVTETVQVSEVTPTTEMGQTTEMMSSAETAQTTETQQETETAQAAEATQEPEIAEDVEPELILTPDIETEQSLDELESEWAEEAGLISNEADLIAVASVNAQNIDLYALDDSYAQKLSIPSDYPQEFQLQVTDKENATYWVTEGESVTVTEDGLICPATRVMYWNGSVGSSWPTGQEGEQEEIEYIFGTSIVQVMDGASVYNVTVTVHDYADIYAEGVMDQYLADNIKAGMSDYELLDTIARFPAQYDYDAHYSGYTGMIIFGGGDCWASTDAIMYLCKKMGLQARDRAAATDYGAGSGHRNVVISLNGKTYMADAGYVEAAPRYYLLEEIDAFRYSLNEDKTSVTITEYIGADYDVEIPDYIDGYAVTAIGDGAFYWNSTITSVHITEKVTSIGAGAFAECDELKSVSLPAALKVIGEDAFNDSGVESIVIPPGVTEIKAGTFDRSNLKSVTFTGDQLKTIGELAFHWCKLTSVEIPAGVESIGKNSFTANYDLAEINVVPENAYYSSVDGVLFNKTQTVLLQYPAKKAQSSYDIPQSVTTIGYSAFEDVGELKKVTIPKSVTSVGEYAFGASESLEEIWFEGEVPQIEERVFSSTYRWDPYTGDYIYNPHTIYYPKKNTSWTENFRKSIKGNLIWKDYCGTLKEPGHKYKDIIVKAATCSKSGKKYQRCTVCGEQTGEQTIAKTAHTYGAYKTTKAATVMKAGTQTRTCSVCGAKQTKSIAKLKAAVKLNVKKIPLQVKKTFSAKAYVTGLQKGDSIKTWTSSKPKVATVDKKTGKVTAKKKGTAFITVTTAGGAKAKFTVTVQTPAVKTTAISGLKKSASVKTGKTITLKPTITPVTSQDKLTYASSNKKVATVSAKGVVKGLKAGTAKITVKSGKKKFVVTVKVTKPAVTAIKNVPKSVSVKKGKTYTLKPKFSPAGSSGTLKYTSSNKKVATVNAKGKITAKKKGTATITVQTGKIKVTCKVTVK